MIEAFVKQFMDAKPVTSKELRANHPDGYDGLVRRVIAIVAGGEDGDSTPDPDRITVIDHGSYQGTRLFVIGETGYQPSVYWTIFVNYGSCSGCDTLEGIRGYSDEPPTDEQVGDYWTLMLHMVQSMKRIGSSEDAILRLEAELDRYKDLYDKATAPKTGENIDSCGRY